MSKSLIRLVVALLIVAILLVCSLYSVVLVETILVTYFGLELKHAAVALLAVLAITSLKKEL
jgi:hypothetical protein